MKFTTLGIALLISTLVFSQESKPEFWSDIQRFKAKDSANFPGSGQILFVGSSSFTKWTDIQQYFPAYPIINRGFGGSTLPDLIVYADDIITPYHAKQVVIYCGENDLAESDATTPEMVVDRFKTLFKLIRSKDPNVRVTFISLKPSPSRARLFQKVQVVNRDIRDFLQKQKNTSFVNVHDKMLKANGTPMEDIFIEDRLHMNAKGYAIWQKEIEPFLLK